LSTWFRRAATKIVRRGSKNPDLSQTTVIFHEKTGRSLNQVEQTSLSLSRFIRLYITIASSDEASRALFTWSRPATTRSAACTS